ncbi:hypothetical protein SLEP1_g33847 [Rubroshorea leprosula]|uniref:Uncharacterized protein n=1 Tax=Rubroshorea leprosula TaxID=152421 RepID=A0AAV5KI19_9ROSI|nr:hypothetical protein SLEP1_g33847 [Rubroshorea leprosula]
MPSIPLTPFYDSTLALPSAHLLSPLIFSFALTGPSQIPFPPLHCWSAAAEAINLLTGGKICSLSKIPMGIPMPAIRGNGDRGDSPTSQGPVDIPRCS